MNIENIRNEFPQMPEDIRAMIAKTVSEQMRSEMSVKPRKRHTVRRTDLRTVLDLDVDTAAAKQEGRGAKRRGRWRLGDRST